jgi:SpoVK/Ycf46/Vps4 family AAA+-type ATPase
VCACAEMASCRQAVMSEVLVTSPLVRWDDIAGMDSTKRILQEAVVLPSMRPDIFTGLRAPSRGVLIRTTIYQWNSNIFRTC